MAGDTCLHRTILILRNQVIALRNGIHLSTILSWVLQMLVAFRQVQLVHCPATAATTGSPPTLHL